jgi:hypothetical protein
MENVWYSCCPSWWAASAVQVTVAAALVILAPSTVTGAGRAASVIFAVQPSMGLTETDVNGVAVGSVTVTLVVLAVSDSLGTRKVSCEKPPAEVDAGSTWTWADAEPTPRTIRPAAAAATVTVFSAEVFSAEAFVVRDFRARVVEAVMTKPFAVLPRVRAR